MATYPIKMLRDENQEPFVPMVSADSIYTSDGKSFEENFASKLEASNLKEGNGIILEQDGNDMTISVDFGATDNIIDNLNTTVAGQGPLDARQGNVLKNMIPVIVDNLDSTDAAKVLSANQGHELKEMSVPTGGTTGQVLKKASNNDHELEWGDAADPNAIVGDGSIMKIIELTYAEYKTLESNGELREDTEYHITDMNTPIGVGIKASQVEMSDGFNVEEVIRDDQGHIVNLSNRMDTVEDRLDNKDIIDEGQNTRLDIAESNIDTVADVVNDILERKRIETEYLGENPDIDLYHNGPGVYGIYNCSKAPVQNIGVLEVLYYSYDWTVQRFTMIDYGGTMHMWERCFYSGMTWGPWTQRW